MSAIDEIVGILETVPTENIIYTVITVICIIAILVRIIPVVAEWFNAARAEANELENMVTQIEANAKAIKMLESRLNKQGDNLSVITSVINRQQHIIDASLEERGIMMRSLLGVVKGLQELGANGPTKKVEHELQDYLVRQSHQRDDNTSMLA